MSNKGSPIPFMPLSDKGFIPNPNFGHVMNYKSLTLKEAIDDGVLELFLTLDIIGFDIETNGLDASRSDFKWSGMGLASHGKLGIDGLSEILSHPKDSELNWLSFTSVWIEFRGYEEYIPEVSKFLLAADKKKLLIAHNSAYEFKCAYRNLGIQLWNLQDSRAYLAAGFFSRMALKMNAKILVNAHEWEEACSDWRSKSQLPKDIIDDEGKKERVEGLSESEAWGSVPTKILGPYCAWDCVYTISMKDEIVRRSTILLDAQETMDYPSFLPIDQSQEVYRRQIILSGIIDDKGVPTTKKAFDKFLSWGLQHEIQHKTWFCHKMGLDCDLTFLSEDIGIDLNLPWEKLDTIEKLMEVKTSLSELVSLDKRGKDYNYNLWNNLIFDNGHTGTFRKFMDAQHKANKWRDNPTSSWRHWSGMGDHITSMRKDTTTMMFQASGEDLLNDPTSHGIALGKLRWGKQVGKMVGDALSYEKRPETDDGQTLPVHKGRFETDYARLGFSWNPVSKETRRWASGFHIVSPNARVHDIFQPKEGRIQIHADLSGAEIQCSSAQAGDIATLEAFIDGLDLHLRNASNSFGKPESEISKEERTIAKIITFRLLFGSTVEGISAALGIEMDKAMAIVKAFFDANPELKKFLDIGKDFANTYGCRCSIFGDLLGLGSDAVATKFHNIIVQNSSSNLMGLGLFDLQRNLILQNLDSYIFGFVHDSTDIDTPTKKMFKIISLMQKCIGTNQLKNWGIPARLDYEVCANGGKFHASHFHGLGSKSDPWLVTIAPGLSQDAEVLLETLSKAFNVNVISSNEDPNDKYTTIQDIIMAPLEYKTFPSFENERKLSKIGYELSIWSEDKEDHVDLSHMNNKMDKSLIDCSFPKNCPPMWVEK